MSQKFVPFFIFTALILNISAKSINDSSEDNNKNIPESLKKFVEFVNKHNLNVSVIASQNKGGKIVKEQIAMTFHMPTNDKKLTASTLDTTEQERYIQTIKDLKNKEIVGAKVRTISIQNGRDEEHEEKPMYNPKYFIDSPNYRFLTSYSKGKKIFYHQAKAMEDLHNFVVKEDDEKNIQVITGYVEIEAIDSSPDMPMDKYKEELNKSLPLIWMSADNDELVAKLLVAKLDKAFSEKNHQVLVGVNDFFSSSKHWARFKVGDSNVIIFNLPLGEA